MRELPATVVSSTSPGPLDWPDATVAAVFPVITGNSGEDPLFRGAADFDLELLESHTLDGHTQERTYRPTLHA
jgi:hypothetical protein